MSVPLLKTNSAKEYVKWISQMDAYSVYKEFSEVMKATKYAKLPDNEKEYESDEETEIDLKLTDVKDEALLKNWMAVTAILFLRSASSSTSVNLRSILVSLSSDLNSSLFSGSLAYLVAFITSLNSLYTE